MARSEEAASWYTMVYRAVQEVPHGKVTSYGHIASLLGYRWCSHGLAYGQNHVLTNMQLSDHGMSTMAQPTLFYLSFVIDPSRHSQVGMCLKYLPSASDQPDAKYNGDTVPWQRVINSKGVISNRGANGAARQEAALSHEGVAVGRGSLGERTVDFSTYGWFPARLPSEDVEGEGGEGQSADEEGEAEEEAEEEKDGDNEDDA